ncbi:hypothetical protein VUR80DRAFT_6998 [Thermomyces stellatus]
MLACAAGRAYFAGAHSRMRDLALRYYTAAPGRAKHPAVPGAGAGEPQLPADERHAAVHARGVRPAGPTLTSVAPRGRGRRASLRPAGGEERAAADLPRHHRPVVGGREGDHPTGSTLTSAEDLLERATFFPGRSTSFNSLVLGVPVTFFRLTLFPRPALPWARDSRPGGPARRGRGVGDRFPDRA